MPLPQFFALCGKHKPHCCHAPVQEKAASAFKRDRLEPQNQLGLSKAVPCLVFTALWLTCLSLQARPNLSLTLLKPVGKFPVSFTLH